MNTKERKEYWALKKHVDKLRVLLKQQDMLMVESECTLKEQQRLMAEKDIMIRTYDELNRMLTVEKFYLASVINKLIN